MVPSGAKVFFNRIVAALIGREGDLGVAEKALAEEMPPLYDYLEGVVPPASAGAGSGEGWLAGDRLSIADISVASVFVNMMHCGGSPDPARYPKLTAYVQRWFERPSLKPIIAREKAFLSQRG